MHTEYFVNGKKTDLGGYMYAEDENLYREKAFEKAKKYYKEHPQEWEALCSMYSKEILGMMMIMQYESTKEGRIFREEWLAGREKRLHKQAGCGLYFYLAIIIGSILMLIFLNVCK